MITSIRGFRDILPPESEGFTRLENLARGIFALYGFREIRLPTLEMRELFVKSTGETTDIVEKEMYVLTDAGGRELALRPEGTPGVARAYIENALNQQDARAKLFYIGSMFRAERPQAGRFREFEQIGVEYIGNPHPSADVESIVLLRDLLEEAGVVEFNFRINSLGCNQCRLEYRRQLQQYLEVNQDSLCENCKRRIQRNPLRALDCKADGPKLSADAPKMQLCRPCHEHFEEVKDLLGGRVSLNVDSLLVRGLDYYTGIVFEVVSSVLGAQNAIAAGGRYDALIKSMGGPDVPAVGWAMGVDRTLQARVPNVARGAGVKVFVIGLGSSIETDANRKTKAFFDILCDLRRAKISADFANFGQSLKSQMRSADKSGAAYAVIVGENELISGGYTVKNLTTGEQKSVPKAELIQTLKEKVNL